MTGTLRAIALLTLKDLRVEARSRQTLGLVALMGVLIIVVLGLGLGARAGCPPTSTGDPVDGLPVRRGPVL